MNRKEFEEYCEMFNSGSEKADVFDRYYDPDAVFEHPLNGTFKGKKAIVEFWTAGHKGIHEVLKPLNVLFDADRIATEFLIEWRCLEDTDYLGPRRKGDVYYVECAAFYHLENGRFIHVKLYLREKKGVQKNKGSPIKGCPSRAKTFPTPIFRACDTYISCRVKATGMKTRSALRPIFFMCAMLPHGL